MVEIFMVEKSGVEKFIVERSPGLKQGVEKSGVEMSFNQLFDLFLKTKMPLLKVS